MEISNKTGRIFVIWMSSAFLGIIIYILWKTPNPPYWILLIPFAQIMLFYKKVNCSGNEIILSYPFRFIFRKIIICNEDILKVRFIAYSLGANSNAQISIIHKRFPFYFEFRPTDKDDSFNFFKWTINNSSYKTSSSEQQERYITQRLDEEGLDYKNIRFKHKSSKIAPK